jgi:hypothetical protein
MRRLTQTPRPAALLVALGMAALLASVPTAIGQGGPSATLSVTMPTTVRVGSIYTIKVSGNTGTAAELWVLSELDAAACKPTANEESGVAPLVIPLPAKPPAKVQPFGVNGPFRTNQQVMAGRKGTRRICAYLEPQGGPGQPPLATASARFVELAPSCKKGTGPGTHKRCKKPARRTRR